MKTLKNKDNLLILPIERYILHEVARRTGQSLRLPGEMELCEKFQVSRGTVRRAMAHLIERGVVLRLPKRRGYFSNPKFSRSGALAIGILVGNGYISAMSYISANLFCGFVQGIRPGYCNYDFMSISSPDLNDLTKTIEITGVEALLWISPMDENIPAIDELTAQNFPVVAIEDVYLPNTVYPEHNFLFYDRNSGAELRAQQLLAENCRQPLYCSDLQSTPQAFADILRTHGVDFDDSRLLSGIEHLGEALTKFLDKKAVDSIVCDGDTRRYQAVLEALKAHPQSNKVKVYFEKGVDSERLIEHYPEQNIKFLNLVDVPQIAMSVGLRAGQLMNSMLKGQMKIFPRETFR